MTRRAPAPPSLFSEPKPAADANPEKSVKSGWINAHCDGGARGNPGPAGYGAVIQDADRLANQAMDRGMRRGQSSDARPHAGQPAPPPPKATPYPTKSETPPDPY